MPGPPSPEKLKERLCEVVFETFKEEVEKGRHKSAAEVAEDFKWIYPKHRFLQDIINISKEKFEQYLKEKKYSAADHYFGLIMEFETGNEATNFLLRLVQAYDLTLGGFCPWCGSNRLWGRKGWLWRFCKKCNVRFDKLCPICKSPHLSWTWNPEKKEYGCDRCQQVATPEEIKEGKYRPSPFFVLKSTQKKDDK
jgi:hypothetical protein